MLLLHSHRYWGCDRAKHGSGVDVQKALVAQPKASTDFFSDFGQNALTSEDYSMVFHGRQPVPDPALGVLIRKNA